jgi:hypothetical protein
MIVRIMFEDEKYVVYYRDKVVTRQNSLEKAAKKLAAYAKGQN